MKKIALALVVSISLLTPVITRPFAWNVAGHIALLAANTGSTLQRVHYLDIYTYGNVRPPLLFGIGHFTTIVYLYYHSASQLLKAYQEYKQSKENITVRG